MPTVVLLVGLLAFGLGRISKLEAARGGLQIIQNTQVPSPNDQANLNSQATSAGQEGTAPAPKGSYVASKNGTKYYLTTCSAADRIKASNKIYFETKQAAQAHGLSPAANCPGI